CCMSARNRPTRSVASKTAGPVASCPFPLCGKRSCGRDILPRPHYWVYRSGLGQVTHMKIRKGKTKVNKLFGASAYSPATEVNYEGAPSFVHNDEEALVRVLTTGAFEPTFYASDAKLAQEALANFAHFAAKDPHFLAQAI